MNLQQPVVSVCHNPFLGTIPGDQHEVPIGSTLQELAPEKPLGLLVCRINGGPGFVLREDWGYPVQIGDVVEFIDYPQSGDTLRSVLQIALFVVALYFHLPWLAAFGTLAINALLPPTQPTRADPQTASPTYSTSLSGNQARPDSPIPRICGRHQVSPPFAGQPYVEYDSVGDQYYYAVLVVGYGQHDIERAMIDDTPITHFTDIVVNAYLPPGTQPTRAKANVVTAPEVASMEMLSGKFVGGFAASGPTLLAAKIGIDMIAPRGLAHQNDDGSMGNKTMSWRVDWREIDDFGAALTAWAILGTESRTANLIKVQRWTSTYTLPSAKRVEIRTVRTDVKSTSSRDSHDLQWAGLRAYLSAAAPLNAGTAHYEIVMRASEQLSSLAQRSIALIPLAKCRTWNPTTGWGSVVHTRNGAWWITELASNAVWGIGLPDARIDLLSFYNLSLLWDTRQDRFDFVFDTTMDAWEAMQMIARAGRARVFRRNGVLTIARDGLVTLPVTAFTTRNTQPNSMDITEGLPTKETNDGFIIEYFHNRTWTWRNVLCPCPGITTMTKPVRLRLAGITGPKHAEREGKYEAARMLYRRRTVKCVTEMQGLLPSYMDLVRWMPEIYGYGQTGDVVDWNASTLTLTLSEPPTFAASNYLTLVRDDGTLTTPVVVLPGPVATQVTLPAAPDFTLVLDDSARERPKFLFGPLNTSDEVAKILSITDGGKTAEGAQLYALQAQIDDARVHAADNLLLPSPGEVQDPVNSAADVPGGVIPGGGGGGGGGTGGGSLIIVNLSAHRIDDINSGAGAARARFSLKNDGNATGEADNPYMLGIGTYFNEWLQFAPQEVATCALFECRATQTPASIAAGGVLTAGSALGVWLNLGTTRYWECSVPTTSERAIEFDVEIREVSTGIVQVTQRIILDAYSYSISGGEGGG